MRLETASIALSALGHEARLSIFRRLVRGGTEGINVGQLATDTGMPLSTLFHHLSQLERAGLVRKHKQGRETHCHPDFRAIRELSTFLLEDCCRDQECG